MLPAILACIHELRSKAGLLTLTCGCHALAPEYVPRRAFTHRCQETHELACVSHAGCRDGHRCGRTGTDSQHRGLCGPGGLPAPRPAIAAPTPDGPPIVAVPLPPRRVPAPVPDRVPVTIRTR